MKDLDRIVRRRSKGESPQAHNDRVQYYADKWQDAYFSDDTVLRMCAVMIVSALDAPEVLKAWQFSEKYANRLLKGLAGNYLYSDTDPE